MVGQARTIAHAEPEQLRTAREHGFDPLIHGGFDPAQGSLPSGNYTSRVEHGNVLLLQAAVYFAAAVIAVMAAHRLGLGSVAGYLLAGIAIGPWGLKLIEQPEAIRAFAELGVVFLLFVIGLELEPHRLWSMRTRLIGLGLSQVVGSILLIAGVALLFRIDMRVALVAGHSRRDKVVELVGIDPAETDRRLASAGGGRERS